MSKIKRPSKVATKPAPQDKLLLTPEQQAVGIALAGSSIVTPLLLALLDKVLTLDEIQTICGRAKAIAGNFSDLPEGKFALACLEDFLLARDPVSQDTNSLAPDLVPWDQPASAERPEDITAS